MNVAYVHPYWSGLFGAIYRVLLEKVTKVPVGC